MTKYCRSNAKFAEIATDLTPPAFDKNIPIAGVIVSGSNPDCMGMWRSLPLARLPTVGIPVPAVIPADPHMLAARTCRTLFMDADWRTKLYHDGRINGRYPKSKAKQRRKNKFSHFLLLPPIRARAWPFTYFRYSTSEDAQNEPSQPVDS
jgi:hypothetical protein